MCVGFIRANGLRWLDSVALVHKRRGLHYDHARHSWQALHRISLLELVGRDHEHRQSAFLLSLRDWWKLRAHRGNIPTRDQRIVLPHDVLRKGLDRAPCLTACGSSTRHSLHAHSKDLFPDTYGRSHAKTIEAT